MTSNKLSVIYSPCLVTESYSIYVLYLTFRIIAFLTNRHYGNNTTAQCLTVSMETINTYQKITTTLYTVEDWVTHHISDIHIHIFAEGISLGEASGTIFH